MRPGDEYEGKITEKGNWSEANRPCQLIDIRLLTLDIRFMKVHKLFNMSGYTLPVFDLYTLLKRFMI